MVWYSKKLDQLIVDSTIDAAFFGLLKIKFDKGFSWNDLEIIGEF